VGSSRRTAVDAASRGQLRAPAVLRRARSRVGPAVVALGLVLLAVELTQTPGAARAAGDPCGPPVTSVIACENSKPGNPASEWDVSGNGDPSIQGFATDISVDHGQTVHFKIKTTASAYHLDIYRMGYYGGAGARLITTVQPSAQLPQNQPNCLTDNATGLIDCGNWAESASWAVPSSAVSGIYFARLVRNDNGGASHIVFIVRDDERHADLLFQTADETWQAYNTYGGNSLYRGNSGVCPGRACKVSYNRPFDTRGNGETDSWVFNAEYPMVRWLEKNGYDVSYEASVDTARHPSELQNHKIFLSNGHDEYWSGDQRTAVEQARDAGVNLAFFSGNEIFWKTRWEPSVDGSATPFRTLVCYKEEYTKIDPTPAWTGQWADDTFSPPSDGGRPQNQLTGTLFGVDGGYRKDSMTVPGSYGNLRFWRNTAVASLPPNGTANFGAGTLGFEWDMDTDDGVRPPGLFDMSSTSVTMSSNSIFIVGYGYTSGTATHSLTMYKAPSGALVFGAGNVQWSWGLDNHHDTMFGDTVVPDPVPSMEQATVNLFADMHAQPATLQSDLVAATASTDATAPATTITSPAPGATIPHSGTVNVTGTASDTGGGVVAGVEVSVDSGQTWHPAVGRTSWTYAWSPGNGPQGSLAVKARAVDDSGNITSPPASVTVTVGSGSPPPPPPPPGPPPPPPPPPPPGSGLLGDGSIEPNADSNPVGIAEGFAYVATGTASIDRLHAYLDSTNTAATVALGVYSDSNGHPASRLGTCTITSPQAGAWNACTLASPVALTSGTTYWLPILQPTGVSGTLKYRNGGRVHSETNSGALAALPATWTVGGGYTDGPASIWADLSGPPPPDLTAPTMQLPANITVTAVPGGEILGAVVNYTVTATDPDDPPAALTISCAPPSGGTFPVGTTTVHCTASDPAGNSSNGSFTVTVNPPPPPDTTAPTLNLPADITVTAPSGSGAVVTYTVTATDPDDAPGSLTIQCTPSSGSTFPIGTTTVNCTARDPAGNTSGGSFHVTVNPPPPDLTPPTLTLPANITVNATTPSGATVTYTVTATDPDNPPAQLTITCSPTSGSTFPIGTTTVNCTARDPFGNATSGSFSVTVNQPPASTGLVGDQTLEPSPDTIPGGTAEAFPYTASSSGPITRLHVYLDAGTTVTQAWVGIYTETSGRPGTLLGQAQIPIPLAGAWNVVSIPSATITSGTRYWLALLNPRVPSAGTLKYRTNFRTASQTAQSRSLTTLPSTWTPGTNYTDGSASFYADF
jgi:hypothetical protein